MNTEREKQQHNCKFCGKSVYDNHDSFWNDLVIHQDDSPELVKTKMERQDRLKFRFHDNQSLENGRNYK